MTENDRLGNAPESAEQGREKRKVPRIPLIATAEIVEPGTGTRLNARVSEISLHGCYIDAMNPFPAGTLIYLRIVRDAGTFVTRAKIRYVHPGMGMGAVFVETPADQMAILEKWLVQL